MSPLIHTIKYSFFTLLFLNHLPTLTSQNPEEQILFYKHAALSLIVLEHGPHGNNPQRDPRLHQKKNSIQLLPEQRISEIEMHLATIETTKEQSISDLKNGLDRLENMLLNNNDQLCKMLLSLKTNHNPYETSTENPTGY